MLTPQLPGFTGVDWYSRPTERLATELLGGAGARPLTTAAQETARLASAYGAAAVALDRLLVRLDGAVELGTTAVDHAAVQRSGAKRDGGPLPEYARWLARHAADLAEYAAKLAGQAAAYDAASRAMPSVADALRLKSDRETAQAAAATGGAEPAAAALVGAAVESERVEQQTHGTAAQTMVGFERASEPLSKPWEFTAPPKQAEPKKPGSKTKSTGTGAGGGGGGIGVPAAPLGSYAATTPQRDQSTTTVRPTPNPSNGNAGRGIPMMPAGMLGAGAAGNRGTTHQGGATPSDGTDEIDEVFVVHSAPAVLGANGTEAMEDAL